MTGWGIEDVGDDAVVLLSRVGRLKLLDFYIKDQKEALDFTNIITAFLGFRSCTDFE